MMEVGLIVCFALVAVMFLLGLLWVNNVFNMSERSRQRFNRETAEIKKETEKLIRERNSQR